MSSPPAQPPRPTNPKPQTPPSPRPPKYAEAEEMYPVTELAEKWRCSVGHVYHLIARGQLRSIQIGIGRAKTRIPASAAAEFIAKQSKGRAA